MRYALIAAGEGSRLSSEGINIPKPLIEVGGERLLDRLLRCFTQNKAEEVCVICNSQMPAVARHLEQWQQNNSVPLHVKVKSTPSSMHSLWELREWLKEGPFVLTTVDTIFQEQEFSRFVCDFEAQQHSGEGDGLMGVTDFIDDESPLHVVCDDTQSIIAFLDATATPHYVSAGVYGLSNRVLAVLQHCVDRGEHRLRNFQRAMLDEGLRLTAWPFSKVLDIDHASDIQKAELFLDRE